MLFASKKHCVYRKVGKIVKQISGLKKNAKK